MADSKVVLAAGAVRCKDKEENLSHPLFLSVLAKWLCSERKPGASPAYSITVLQSKASSLPLVSPILLSSS